MPGVGPNTVNAGSAGAFGHCQGSLEWCSVSLSHRPLIRDWGREGSLARCVVGARHIVGAANGRGERGVVLGKEGAREQRNLADHSAGGVPGRRPERRKDGLRQIRTRRR